MFLLKFGWIYSHPHSLFRDTSPLNHVLGLQKQSCYRKLTIKRTISTAPNMEGSINTVPVLCCIETASLTSSPMAWQQFQGNSSSLAVQFNTVSGKDGCSAEE